MKKSQRWKRPVAHLDDEASPRDNAASPRDETKAAQNEPVRARVPASWLSRHWRGIALDLAVIVCNLFLLAPLARLLREGGQGFLAPGKDVDWKVSSSVGWLFLSVFAAYTVGVFLKRAARQARLDASAAGAQTVSADSARAGGSGASSPARMRRPRGISAGDYRRAKNVLVFAVCALLLFHFFIFMTLLTVGWQSTGLENFSPLFGSSTAGNSYFNFFVRFVLLIFILPLPTGLTLYYISVVSDVPAPSDSPRSTLLANPAVEIAADLLLYFSVVVITLILNVLLAPRFVNVEGAAGLTLDGVITTLIPLALAFSAFYLPPRLVYLAEDYRSPLAWLMILLALLSLAYRTFFPDNMQW
ncbi:MAG TPA: hypothetical protein VFA21_05235 [Pyrinomonadaceae bacterium]|jgi:hypothetical protein|nr:hypothetical protein [Pyrinomonadaceae bacterium]